MSTLKAVGKRSTKNPANLKAVGKTSKKNVSNVMSVGKNGNRNEYKLKSIGQRGEKDEFNFKGGKKNVLKTVDKSGTSNSRTITSNSDSDKTTFTKAEWRRSICVAFSVVVVISILTELIYSFLIFTLLKERKASQMELRREIDAYIDQRNETTDNKSMDIQILLSLVSRMERLKQDLEVAKTSVLIAQASSTNRILESYTPAASCASILKNNPKARSGYYYIRTVDGLFTRAYCDMTKTCGSITGGWMRVARTDTKRNSRCPPGLCLDSSSRTCVLCTYGGGCSFDVYPVGVNYSKVCGRVIGYQRGQVDAFSERWSIILDGVMLTLQNPPRYIWSFVASQEGSFADVCPCLDSSDTSLTAAPEFIGSNYFCDTIGYQTPARENFGNESLWAGKGCSSGNACCNFNNPPWFYRDLNYTTADNIEMKLCRSENRGDEDIGIEKVDILVQ